MYNVRYRKVWGAVMLDEELEELKDKSDAQLVMSYKNGDQTAFQQLAARYFFVIRKNASDYYGMGLEADDLFQEGLLGLDNAAKRYDEDNNASFKTYASVCIRNRILSALRACNTEKNKINKEHYSIDEAEFVCSSPETEPENAVISNEALESLQAYLQSSLSKNESDVLELYIEGKTYEEIASKLGINKKACDNAMQRVRKKLRIRG